MENHTTPNGIADAAASKKQTGIIAWFAYNPVAANLLMMFLLIVGFVSYQQLPRQMFPNFEFSRINVSVNYRGASPQEIEESIMGKIEKAVKDIPEIEKKVTRSWRGGGRVMLQVDEKANAKEILDEVKNRLDSIATFPADMEPLNINQWKARQGVMRLAVVGDMPVEKLKPFAKTVENEMLGLNNVSIVNMWVPNEEIAIEIEPDALRQYNLTINDVIQAINRYSTNISAGQMRTNAGTISVRIENQFYHGHEFRAIPIKIGANGSKIFLGDIATIRDGFEEGINYFKHSGKNAISFFVEATSKQNIMSVADSLKQYIQQKNKTLPQGITIEPVVDLTYYLNGRLNMMLENLALGAVLVAIMLGLFMRLKLAFWVIVGLPVCFLGALMLMNVFSVTINLMTLFGFIMVLGIVVDDAIVIGESAYTETEQKGAGIDNIIRGAKRVATPATFGVLTTIAVFVPMLFGSGPQGSQMGAMAAVVICCLVFSLVESKLILPAHLAHSKFKPVKPNGWREKFNRQFNNFIRGPYLNLVKYAVAWRWSTLTIFIGLLMVAISLISANHVRFVAAPPIPHDFPSISLEMNENASDEQMLQALKTVENVVYKVEEEIKAEYGQGMIRDVLVWDEGRTSGELMAPLVDESVRPFTTFELSRRWREKMPEIPGLRSIRIQDSVLGNSDDRELEYRLFGKDLDALNAAGRRFIQLLQDQEGVYDLSSSIDPASKQIQISLLPVAYDLGLDLNSIALQTGASFYGGQAQRILRNGEEVRVMVRYPKMTRENLAELKYTLITTPSGQQVMLGDVVELSEKPGISYIRRDDGYRSVYIGGAIDEEVITPNELVKKVKEELLPQIENEFPGVTSELGGSIKEQQDQQDEQSTFFIIGMLMVYILLAIPLKSYGQPLIVMSVIPFSFTGAVAGHFMMGMDLSLFSIFGLIAAAGVVVNDSLVMTDFVNQYRKEGHSVYESVIEAGCARFRAIFLTSLTTFMGVMPILLETSLQAQFVIPMATSLGFAVLYATLVTLILVPCLYMIGVDIGRAFSKLKTLLLKAVLFFGRSKVTLRQEA